MAKEPKGHATGLALGVFAYLFWGISPVYFKALQGIEPLVVLSQRVVGSVVLLGVIIVITRTWGQILPIVRSQRSMTRLLATTGLIAANWFCFIYAIQNKQALQASLGYFLTPLVSACLAMVFLHERLRPVQWVSLVLAATGVFYLIASAGTFPVLAIGLAISFGFYGLLRKQMSSGPIVTLWLETLLLLPLAVIYLQQKSQTGSVMGHTGTQTFLLMLAGPVTTIPLLAFTAAARRLTLTTLGFMQYIGPTVQFIVAVTYLNETLRPYHTVTFSLIWAGIAIYVAEAVWNSRRSRQRGLDVVVEPD